MLTKLVDQVLDDSSTTTASYSESNKKKVVIKIKSSLTDGAYDFNAYFQYLQKKGLDRE
jgi:methionine-rich copper-binding protein CopC